MDWDLAVHLAKMAAAVVVVAVLLGLAVQGALKLTDGPWDKEELRDDERPIDFIGRSQR